MSNTQHLEDAVTLLRKGLERPETLFYVRPHTFSTALQIVLDALETKEVAVPEVLKEVRRLEGAGNGWVNEAQEGRAVIEDLLVEFVGPHEESYLSVQKARKFLGGGDAD